MKHFHVVAALLVLGLLANVTLASAQAGRLSLPSRDVQEQAVKAKPPAKALTPNTGSETFGAPLPRRPMADAGPIVLTKTPGTMGAQAPASGLSGTFQIGAAHQFKTLADIAFLLNVSFLGGPVTFELTDASYTDTVGVAIGNVVGSSATNTITIHPAAGNTSCVITVRNNIANGGGIVFSGTQYCTIDGHAVGQPAGERDMTIQLDGVNPALDPEAAVRLINTKNFTVENAVIAGESPSQAWTGGSASVSSTSSSGDYTSFLTVNNCELHGGHYGVHTKGNYMLNAGVYGVQDDDIAVTNNYVHDVTEMGIVVEQSTINNVSGNTVHRVVLGSGAGPSPNLQLNPDGTAPPSIAGAGLANYPLFYRVAGIVVWGDHTTISKNDVDSVINNRTSGGTFGAQSFGIRLIGFASNDPDPEFGGGGSMAGVNSHGMVKNNIVTRVFSKATQNNGLLWHAVGIEMQAGRWDSAVFNTVYMSGAEIGNPGSSVGILINGAVWTPPSVFGGNAGFPAWTLGSCGANVLFSYRVAVINNIIAIDRTGSTGINACLAPQNATSSAGFVSDYRPPSDHNVLYMGVAGDVARDSRGSIWASLADFQAGAPSLPVDAHSQADSPTLVSASDVHINPAGFSTADGNGITFGSITDDYAGTVRTSPPDIGALEGTGAGQPHDVKPLALLSPGGAGAPAGLPFTGLSMKTINLTANAETNVACNIHILAPDASTADFPGTFSVAAFGTATVAIAGTWTPPVGGDYVFTVTTSLVGDNYPNNDTLVVHIPVAGQVASFPYTTSFENPTETAGWFGESPWAVGSNTGGNTKFGGARTGDKAYVTGPGAAGTNGYPTGGVTFSLYSPFFDLTSATDGYVYFYQAVKTEPEWDRSVMQYTLDTGKTWIKLGVLNEPNGINWYSSGTYQNAAGANGYTCYDSTSANTAGVRALFGAPGFWTSNGDCTGADAHTGPNGYVYVQIKLPAAVLGKSFVRFKYECWSDAGSADDGWAMDDFTLSLTPPAPPLKAMITGTVYLDADGSKTINGGDTPLPGAKVELLYFGGHVSFSTTDGSGVYRDSVGLPGVYDVTVIDTTRVVDVKASSANYTGNGTDITGKDMALFGGHITGKVYTDVNGDSLDNDGASGLAGITVNVHADSLTGAVAGTATSSATGTFDILVGPGVYYTTVVLPANVDFHAPVPHYFVDSIGAVATRPNNNFGLYTLGVLNVAATIDINGNGVKDGADNTGLPAGAFATFEITKDGSHFASDTIGNGVSAVANHFGLVPGTYVVSQTGVSALWKQTLTTGDTLVVANSGSEGTSSNIYFKIFTVTGTKYEDLNGNGVKDLGEPGLAGWTINVSGTAYGGATAVTDVNGVWTVDSVGGGKHFFTETAQAGWTQTAPAVPESLVSNYVALWTGAGTGTVTAKNILNFKNICISGVKYRDRNNNGTKEATDEGLGGVNVTVTGTGGTTVPTNPDGTFQICGLGPGAHTVSAVVTAGDVQTQPAGGGNYNFTASSGTDVANLNFGEFVISDSTTLYRTFTAAEWLAASNPLMKPNKRPTVKKPTFPNMANVIEDYFKIKALSLQLGYAPTATAPNVKVGKYADFQKSFFNKGASHNPAVARGLDFYTSGKLIVKTLKLLTADKQSNGLFANLAALKLNLNLSAATNTTAGLGNLIYDDGTTEPSECTQYHFPLNGKTLAEISAIGDTLLTSWQFVPLSCFTRLSAVAANINAAFSQPFTPSTYTDIDSANWWGTAKLFVKGVKPVTAVAYLKANPHPAPIVILTGDPQPLPTRYALYQNYPNPFNPTTSIDFDLPEAANVTITVFNVLGQQVATLLNHEAMDAGNNSIQFDGTDLASGVYLYRIVAEKVNDNGMSTGQSFTQVKKMVLMK